MLFEPDINQFLDVTVQKLAESCTEEDFVEQWTSLVNDPLWIGNPYLQTYVYDHWVKDNQYRVTSGYQWVALTANSCMKIDLHSTFGNSIKTGVVKPGLGD
jgi:hypothetical protein